MMKIKDLMETPRIPYSDSIQYKIGKKVISFHCSGLDEDERFNKNNNAVGELFNAFLLELSEGKKIFFTGYRFFGEETKVVEPSVIVKRAESLERSYCRVFLSLESARVNSLHFHYGCEGGIYYFDSKVKWADFLASYPVREPEKLVEEGLLSALFSYGEFGGEFHFLCNKTYEGRVLQLFEELSAFGYRLQNKYPR